MLVATAACQWWQRLHLLTLGRRLQQDCCH